MHWDFRCPSRMAEECGLRSISPGFYSKLWCFLAVRALCLSFSKCRVELIILSSPQGCLDGVFLHKRHLEESLAHMVGLDIQDEMGRHEVGHIDNSMKIPLNNGAGCRFEGQFSINKVPGNFHVSTHSATAQPQNPDMTHIIHKLSFGDTLQVQNVHGAFNALGGADRLTSNPLASHDYILKIVPTVYEDKSGKQQYSYQYTVANKEYVAYSHTGRIIPAIWFRYDLSPITVKYTERRQPLYRFITTICAIIGGTFTVAGILDSCIFTASEAWKKIQLGKMH
ncbi:endoplasmic reticulum-Golgi intermediate compartment protein 1 isoform X8 [Callithrix jacchus]